jgi:hypothetical protein
MVPLYSSRAWWGVAAAAAALVIGTNCGGGGDGGGNPVEPSVATSVQAASATSQDNQPAGGQVGQPPAVTVRDQRNSVMANVTVTFAVTAGNGTITPTTVATGGDGVARVTSWTLGTAPGVNIATATVGSLPVVTFNATSIHAPVSVQAVSLVTQEAGTEDPVREPPAVVVRDGAGAVMSGVTVTFAVTAGGGTIDPATIVTDANGFAQLDTWTLGPTPGTNTVTATVSGLPPVTFTATGVLLPAKLEAASALNQTALVGTAVDDPPAARVLDRHDNPLAGITVVFAVTGGGGTVTPASVVSGADGVARVTSWTLGATAELNSLTATVTGLSPVLFIASGRDPSVPTTVAATTITTQTAPAGSAVSAPPGVIVHDQYADPMPGVTVSFGVTGGGGSVNPASVTTDAEGKAQLTSWTLGSAAGENTVSATVSGLPPVTFTAQGVLIPASIIAFTSQDQEAIRGTNVAVPPGVEVRDQNDAPLVGANVTFSVTAGGGSVSPTTVATGSDGRAQVVSWTLGQATGPNTVTATVNGLAPVAFNATALPHPCDAVSIPLGTTISDSLVSASCQLASGEFVRFYSFTIATPTTVRLRQNSTQLDAYVLLLRVPDGSGAAFDIRAPLVSDAEPVAENDDKGVGLIGSPPSCSILDGSCDSELAAFLVPGTYLIGASAHDVGETGTFSVRVEQTSSDVTACETFFVMRDVTTSGTQLSNTDCSASSRFTDMYAVYLEAGEQISIEMRSTALDSFLALLAADGSTIVDDNSGTGPNDAKIVYTAPVRGYYTFTASSAGTGETGAYTLELR